MWAGSFFCGAPCWRLVFNLGGMSRSLVCLALGPFCAVSPSRRASVRFFFLKGQRLLESSRVTRGTIPKEPKLPDELYLLALEMALRSRSSQQTCAVLEEGESFGMSEAAANVGSS